LLDFSMESKRRTRPNPTPAAKPTTVRKTSRPKTGAEETPPPVEIRAYDVHMKITGVARDDVQVSRYLAKLSESRLLKDVNLIITDAYKREDEQVRRFQIGMMLDPNAEAPAKPNRNAMATLDPQ
jgi:hypothetical protein